jgi:hypothetical protein
LESIFGVLVRLSTLNIKTILALYNGARRLQKRLIYFVELRLLDVLQYSRSSDIQTKVAELEELNQSLRQRDKASTNMVYVANSGDDRVSVIETK